MERFVIIINGFQSLTIITKRSISDVAAVLDSPLFGFAKWSRELGQFVIWSNRMLQVKVVYMKRNVGLKFERQESCSGKDSRKEIVTNNNFFSEA